MRQKPSDVFCARMECFCRDRGQSLPLRVPGHWLPSHIGFCQALSVAAAAATAAVATTTTTTAAVATATATVATAAAPVA